MIERSPNAGRKVVIVGAGPGGLEAARVCAERGHEVVVHEAAGQAGGQVLIGAQGSWRRDLRGLVDWRVAELERLGVTMRFNSYAESADVLADFPDVVIVATGGVPDVDWIEGADLCTSAWDLLGGNVQARGEVFVYDGTGRHPGPLAAEKAASAGAHVTFASIDDFLAAELTYAERVIWKQRFYELGIPILFDRRLVRVESSGNRLAVTLANDVTLGEATLEADQVVVEHGTRPADELYQSLREDSANDGVTDIDALLAGRPQPREANPDAAFELHRIGDAVASRNVHAAIYDALRLCAVI